MLHLANITPTECLGKNHTQKITFKEKTFRNRFFSEQQQVKVLESEENVKYIAESINFGFAIY